MKEPMMQIDDRDPKAVTAALKRLKREHRSLYDRTKDRLAYQQVVSGDDGAARPFFLFEWNKDDEWVVRRMDLPDEASAQRAMDRMLWHRITETLEQREARAQTLESAQARFPPDRLLAHLELGIRMLGKDFDWEAHEAQVEAAGDDSDLPDDVDDVWRLVTGPILHEGQWTFPVPLAACGSARLDGKKQVHDKRDQPAWVSVLAFYRLLCRIKPPAIDCSDMYKTSICGVVSADLRFAVLLDVWKYAPCLRFWCLPALAFDPQADRAIQVRTGIPGLDMDTSCNDPVGQRFFQFVTAVARTPTMLYGGNDFEV